MPAEYLINPEYRVVFSRGMGDLTYADITGHMGRLTADRRFQSNFKQIVDFTDVADVILTSDELRELASREVFAAGAKRAFVVSSNLHFGLARMFGTHRELAGEDRIEVVRSIPEAVAWVDVPLAVAQQAFSELRAPVAETLHSRASG